MGKNVGKECLFLQLQDLSTRSGLSEGEAPDEPPQPQQRDAGPDSQTTNGGGFHALPHHPGGRVWTASTDEPPTLVGTAAALTPEHHSTFIGINQARLAQPLPCAAFCDNSSLTRGACSGRAEQPCPPISVLITRGSAAV